MLDLSQVNPLADGEAIRMSVSTSVILRHLGLHVEVNTILACLAVLAWLE